MALMLTSRLIISCASVIESAGTLPWSKTTLTLTLSGRCQFLDFNLKRKNPIQNLNLNRSYFGRGSLDFMRQLYETSGYCLKFGPRACEPEDETVVEFGQSALRPSAGNDGISFAYSSSFVQFICAQAISSASSPV